MRKTIPERRINKISQTIKSLRRQRPVSGNNTGKNLSLDILYTPGTQALDNRLFKNHPSKFISVSNNNSKSCRYKEYTLAIWKDYHEERDTVKNS